MKMNLRTGDHGRCGARDHLAGFSQREPARPPLRQPLHGNETETH